MEPDGGQTTVRSSETEGEPDRTGVLAIRWIHPKVEGSLTSLERPQIRLGRGEDCDVRIVSPEASRVHAEIRREGRVHVLRDLDSRNGVYANGERVATAFLRPQLLLRIGDWLGVVTEVEPNELVAGPPAFEKYAQGFAGGPVLRPIVSELRRAAPSQLPVVLVGETGTGKEGAARAIHAWSGRSGNFVAINCAALPSNLAEAELFGYRKGAFTGATRGSLGHFRAADGGTLFLDEIVDLPETLQGKLLRVIEQGEVVPLGESLGTSVDVRIVTATQVPIEEAVQQGRFRADLLARLAGLKVTLPPLRERREEIPFLWSFLLKLHSGNRPPQVQTQLVERLCLYDWPFNVRELDLLVRQLLVLHAHGGVLRLVHLPQHIRAPTREVLPVVGADDVVPNTPEAHRVRRERELQALTSALRELGGNVARAAQAVGISRQRAYRLMRQAAADAYDEAPPDTGKPAPGCSR